MAVLLFLMTLVIAISNAQNPNNGAELISKEKSFDIYSIQNTGPNAPPSGIPNFNFMLNNPVYSPTSDKRQKELIKDKLRSLNTINDREDLSDNLDNNLNDNTNTSSKDIHKAVVEKILELSKYTMEQVNSKVGVISTIHQVYKQNKIYKLGYIISYINKTREEMTHLYKHIEKNKDKWDSLTLLDAYVKMKKTKELVADMLAIVNALSGNQPKSHLYNPKERPYDKNMIAWSYYDDTM